MRILLFDPSVVGHHLEYPSHFMNYVANKGVNHELHFAVHSEFEHRAPDLVELANAYPDRLKVHPIDESEQNAVESASISRRVLSSWNIAEKYARKLEVDHCVFLEMNLYQPVLGLLRARNVPFRISGILFFPYVRIEVANSSFLERVKAKIERYRKHWQIRWVLSNPQMEAIFLFNDAKGAQQLNAIHATNKFRALPDPVLPRKGYTEETASPFKPTDARGHFLFFGAMRKQKGVRELIQAMRLLSEKEARQTALHILGRSSEDFANELRRLVEGLRQAQPHLHVQHEDRFLEYAELERALDSCDVVLAPYQRTEGSSGVIGHAAKHGKPVIGPNTGLIGTLIRDYGLGRATNTSDPSDIAGAIQEALDDPRELASKEDMQRYVNERSPDQFASTVVETLAE